MNIINNIHLQFLLEKEGRRGKGEGERGRSCVVRRRCCCMDEEQVMDDFKDERYLFVQPARYAESSLW